MTGGSAGPPHGTWQRYQYKRFLCRCELCRYAHSAWMRSYKVRRLVDQLATEVTETDTA